MRRVGHVTQFRRIPVGAYAPRADADISVRATRYGLIKRRTLLTFVFPIGKKENFGRSSLVLAAELVNDSVERGAHAGATGGVNALERLNCPQFVLIGAHRGSEDDARIIVEGDNHKSHTGIYRLHNFDRTVARGAHFRTLHRAGMVQGNAQRERRWSHLHAGIYAD
ncbi:MAG TPA: hypothetical protein VFB60_19105 [Ktedonobacteraceae bacterium]|nr:hypothetical protein [Ktedonobacteraceae bacterium]